jgi:uncharacterized protein with FMN-binding domain
MRRITLWLLSTVSSLVLLFSYHTSTSSTTAATVQSDAASGAGAASNGSSGAADTGSSGTGTSGSGSSGTGTSGSGSSSSGSSSGGSSGGGSTSSAAKTYTGAAVSTQYGDVQVQITVSDGRITKAAVLQVPWSNGQDQQINSQAVPILNDEAVQAQSAHIDMVSGASFTSQGYVQSLQSALDKAHL